MSIRDWSRLVVCGLVVFLFAAVIQATPLARGHFRVVRYARSPEGDRRCVQIGPRVGMETLLSLAQPGITGDDVARAYPGSILYACGHTAFTGRSSSRDPAHWDTCAPGAAHEYWLITGETYCLPVAHQPTTEEQLGSVSYDLALERSGRENDRDAHTTALATQRRELLSQSAETMSSLQHRQNEEMHRQAAFSQGQLAELRAETQGRIRFWFIFFAIAAIVICLSFAGLKTWTHQRAIQRLNGRWQLKLNQQRDDAAAHQAEADGLWRHERRRLERRAHRLRGLSRNLISDIRLYKQAILKQIELHGDALESLTWTYVDRLDKLEDDLRAAKREKSESALFLLDKKELEEELKAHRDRHDLLPSLHARCAERFRDLQAARAENARLKQSAESEGDRITQQLWSDNLTESDEVVSQLSAEYERVSEAFRHEFEAATGIRLSSTIFELQQQIESMQSDWSRLPAAFAERDQLVETYRRQAQTAEATTQKANRRIEQLERLLDQELNLGPAEMTAEPMYNFGVALHRLMRAYGPPGSRIPLDRPTFSDLMLMIAVYRAACPVCVEALQKIMQEKAEAGLDGAAIENDEAVKKARQNANPRIILYMPRHCKDEHGDLPPPSGRTIIPQIG